jgi:hypothetical protein
MAIDAIRSLSHARAAHGTAFASPREFRCAVVDSAASALGLGSKNVRFAFANGMSLADLAQMRSVPRSKLVDAVANGIRSLEACGDGLPGAPDPVEMAERIVERPGGISSDRQRHGLGALLNAALGTSAFDTAA